MEKEAIEQLLDSNDIEDNILGIIMADSLGIELGKPAEDRTSYSRVHRRDWTNNNPVIFGGVFLNKKRYWINAYGIYELTSQFTFTNREPVLYNDGSIKGHIP